MIYGVQFAAPTSNTATINTLTDYGLMLCDDLSIETPAPRLKYVEVPELDGALDLTESLTGSVTYSQRKITFTLFAAHDKTANTRTPATEAHFETARQQFTAAVNGKKMKMWLPDDSSHWFLGRVYVGEKSGYNNGKIQVTMIADPYRYGANNTKVM